MHAKGQLASRLSTVRASPLPYEGTGLQLQLPANLCGANCGYMPYCGAGGERCVESLIRSRCGRVQGPARLTGHVVLRGFHLSGFRVTQACGLLPVVRHTGRIRPRPSCRGVSAIRPISSTTNVVGSIGLPPTRASRTILEHL